MRAYFAYSPMTRCPLSHQNLFLYRREFAISLRIASNYADIADT